MMEVAGAAFPITPLLSTCTKIVTILHNVGKRFKRAPLMMTSIATECSLIHVALAQLRSFDWVAIAANAEGRQEQLTRATESIILGCTLTLSVIEEYAVELQEYVDGAPMSPTEQMGIMARVRVLWKEDEMRELLLQLRGYQTGLTGLIRAAHDSDLINEDGDTIGPNSNYTTLLQRSRSSRARKPLSIRAAMQQAATYSSISRPAHTASNSSLGSTGTVQSRQSTAASSITNTTTSSRIRDSESFSSVAGDSYDGGIVLHSPNGRKGSSDATRRTKRPAFLTLAPEESETFKEGQTLHTKNSKDQMRKSSPTVGDKFEFVPGMPPPPSASALDPPLKSAPPVMDRRPSFPGSSERGANKSKRPSKESFHEPPVTGPPRVPLPEPPASKPPSRSPSRSRSPAPKSPIKSILRNGSTADLSNIGSPSHRRRGSSSPPKPSHVDDQAPQDRSSASSNELKKVPSPATPQPEMSHFPAPRTESVTQPRKQRSNSSVRDQIMVLPETARLRKQLSNERLRKQTSVELLGQTTFHDAMPAMPLQSQDRVVMGNAFGRRGSNASTAQAGAASISRSSSFDMLTDPGRKRSVTDLSQHAFLQEKKAQMTLNQKRVVQRAASDARRPANLKYLNVDARPDEAHSPTSDAVTTPSTIPTPGSQTPQNAGPESWPLTPSQGYHGELMQHQTHYGSRHQLHSAEQANARSPTHDLSSLSTESTPRASRSITPHANTPAQRSRSNTLVTIESETAESDKQHGSAAPSVMSAQWYRSPQERLNIGPRVSMAESIPWELDDEITPDPVTQQQSKSRFAQKPRLGGILGANRSETQLVNDGQRQSPPRSPLLTDGFLSNVKTGLPRDNPGNQLMQSIPEAGLLRPSTSLNSTDPSSSTYSDASKKLKKDKKKKEKDPGRVTMKELWGAYKESSNSWYSAQYQRAAEEQRAEAQAREQRNADSSHSSSGRAPSTMGTHAASQSRTQSMTNATTKMMVSPRESTDRGASVSSGSGSSRLVEKDTGAGKKKKKSGGLITMKELWSEYKASTNAWYTSAYKEENVRHLETPDLLGRR